MLLAVDAGNTDTVFGLFDHQLLLHQWRTQSLPHEPGAHYEGWLRLQFLEAGLTLDCVGSVVLGSVVPDLTGVLRGMLATLFGCEPLIVGPEVYPGLTMDIHHPHEIGADLIANAIAAHARYPQTCVIIVDFGTALTFTTVDAAGRILGVAILPGLQTAVTALFVNTAQLPEVPLDYPASAIGKNTVQAIQAGIVLGYEGLVRSMLSRIRGELNDQCPAIATGGLSSVIAPLKSEFAEVDRTLTLDGLRLIGQWLATPTDPKSAQKPPSV